MLGMQEKGELQLELEYQRNRAAQAEATAQQDGIRAQQAESCLDDANCQVDHLGWQLNKMLNKMRKVAIGIHLAIDSHHQVRQSLLPHSNSNSCP